MLDVSLMSAILVSDTVEVLGYWGCTAKSLGALISIQKGIVYIYEEVLDFYNGYIYRSADSAIDRGMSGVLSREDFQKVLVFAVVEVGC